MTLGSADLVHLVLHLCHVSLQLHRIGFIVAHVKLYLCLLDLILIPYSSYIGKHFEQVRVLLNLLVLENLSLLPVVMGLFPHFRKTLLEVIELSTKFFGKGRIFL